jgi:archaetidylinositol phosphate synthase
VWERPTRVAMTGMTLGGAGVVAVLAGSGADVVVTAGAGVGALLGLVATVQLGIWLGRVLAGPEVSGGASPPGGS